MRTLIQGSGWEGLSVGVVCLPRRFASASVTTSRRSSSSSLRCLTAFGRSLGRTCRGPSCGDEICFGAEGDGSSFDAPRCEEIAINLVGLVSSHVEMMP